MIDEILEQNAMETKDLYKRQEALNLNIPENVLIIGLGGIGSWVALNMGLIGVKTLNLIDYDVIEEHNLNRTLFREYDIGIKKVHAITELLIDRRSDIEINVFDKRLEDLSLVELKTLTDCLIIDCRDVLKELPRIFKGNDLIKLGYDGLSVTMILNPVYNKIWGETGGNYDIIPSFLAPCQFLATAVTTLITEPTFNMEGIENKSINFNLNEHFLKMVGV